MTTALGLSLAMGMTSTAVTAAPLDTTAPAPTAATAEAGLTEERKQEILERLQQLVPAETPRADALAKRLHVDTEGRDATLQRAIDGSQYECGPTDFHGWIDEQLADWDMFDLLILQLTGALDWPMYEALLFQPDGEQYFGAEGERTHEMNKTFRTLKKFWDTQGEDIQLGAMHGDVIMDDARMVPFLTAMYGVTEAEAQEMADLVQEFLADPKFEGGNHPIFTLNAFAYSDAPSPEDQQLGLDDKIIMGDGIIEAMEGIGLGDVGPRGILAHEYGHHVQYELGLFDDHARDAEATRETELEADALAGYYLSHPRGERLRQQRVVDFIESFGEVGDCSFENDGHHGTPNQREASARWADELANAKGKKGHIHPAQFVSDAFRAVLPEILAPDA
ncbi:hypothetical protein [Kytococcus sedentarius]|uniref:hypothetical protein n=1 Tax=Kytococcus sedentarius TaxID=1276 RepID=UPI0035BBC90E